MLILAKINLCPFQDGKGPTQPNCQQVASGSPQEKMSYKTLRIGPDRFDICSSNTAAIRSTLVSGSSCFGVYEHSSSLPLRPFLLCTHLLTLRWLMTKLHYHHLAKLFHPLGCLMSLLYLFNVSSVC